MSGFSRPNDNLQQLFPPSDNTIPQPHEVSEVVQLVKEYPSRLCDLRTGTRQFLSAASNVTPIVSDSPVPQGFVDEIIAGNLTHTFAGTTRVQLVITDPAGGAVILGSIAWDGTVIVSLPIFGDAAGTFVVSVLPPRPLVIPPGWTFSLQGATQAAAYVVQLNFLRMRRALADSLLFSA